MERSKEVEMGGILQRKNGKMYQVVIGVDCKGCAFRSKPDYWCEPMVCSKNYRKDRTGVIFIRRKDLEKFPCSFDN